MPEENATDLPQTVSRAAHQEMTDKRNALQEENDTLKATVLDMGYNDKARRHFVDKGVADPEWAASIALPSMKAAEVETDKIG